jgi:serine protease
MLDRNIQRENSDCFNSNQSTYNSWHQSSPFDRGLTTKHQRPASHSTERSADRWHSRLSKWWHQPSTVDQPTAIVSAQDTTQQNNRINHQSNIIDSNGLFSQNLVGNDFLTATSDPDIFNVNTRWLAGSLRADIFKVSNTDRRTIISGNGNVDFGRGFDDLLDLSKISYQSVSFNLADQTGGVVFNPGNGNRVFDAINFSTGQQILFEGIDSIKFAEGFVNLSVVPNDPLFSQQWNLHMMGVQNAWRFTTGSSNVMVGVADSGLTTDYNGFIHPELSNTLIMGNQFVDDAGDNHGTQVQGVIAAKSNNGVGMSGINWNAQVFNIDVLGGEMGDLSVADGAQAMINQARSTGKRLVINMSLGVPKSFDTNYAQDLEQVVKNNPDVLFVIAAGNDGHMGKAGISSPAVLARSYSNVMAVGAAWGTHNKDDNATTPGSRIEYRNFWGSQYGKGLTVMGPSEVIAPKIVSSYGWLEFDYANKFNGTSAATPNVTGVASLVLSANPDLSAARVGKVIAQTAVDVGSKGYDVYTGNGFVNADAAVRRAMAIGRGYA